MLTNTNNQVEYIKRLREYLGLSMAAFGEPLGYSGTHINQLEKNRVPLTPVIIERICDVYGVNLDYFSGKIELEKAVIKSTKEEKNRLVGDRLRNARCKRGLSMRELSRKSGVADSQICIIEKGEGSLTKKTAVKPSDVLEVGVEWLLAGDETKKEYPVDGKMTEWLWKHPEIREELWERMKKDDG